MTTPPALILAAPASGSGKTTLTLALLRCFRRQGLAVASFKVGPDYIDPPFHRAAGGGACYNLDGWAMQRGTLSSLMARAGDRADLLIGEGVMGLFDGAPDGSGSTADLAALAGIPVVLVVDVHAQAASAAATVHGFATFRPDFTIAGVIFNRVGGDGHVRSLRHACRELAPPALGFVPRLAELELPDRHLGLVQAAEHADLEAFLEGAASAVSPHVDLAALKTLARRPGLPPVKERRRLPVLGQRIALAEDSAFAFAYPHLIDEWRRAGAEIVTFSPLADEAPDGSADAVYLPGGYPELHAGRLAANRRFLDGLRGACARQVTVYGECGGYMVLGDVLVDGQGAAHRMAGVLPLETSFAARRLHLGYREVALTAATPLGAAGERFRGHEFHYATVLSERPEAPLFSLADALGADLGLAGCRRGRVMGSFVHLIDAA